MTKPLIAVSPNRFPAEDRQFYKGKELEYGEASMALAIRRAGGVPLMAYRAGAPAVEHATYAADVLGGCSGLVLTGGADVAPESYGETPREQAWAGDPVRDRWELALLTEAERRELPVLAICRGAQLLNVGRGGNLTQDIPSLLEGRLEHRSQEKYCGLGHPITLSGPSRIADAFEDEELFVNSVHHQCIEKLGEGLRVTARSPDGVIEGVEDSGGAWVVGVQWHPEWMPGSGPQERLFDLFIAAAGKARTR